VQDSSESDEGDLSEDCICITDKTRQILFHKRTTRPLTLQ